MDSQERNEGGDGREFKFNGKERGQGKGLPCVRLWEGLLRSRFFNGESSWPVTSLKIFETVDRNARCSSSKLEQSRLLLGIPAANAGPEVPNDLVLLCIAPVVGMLLPIFDVDIGDTPYQKLQFTLIEDVDEVWRDQFVKACDEGVELLFNTLLDSPFSDKSAYSSQLIATATDAVIRTQYILFYSRWSRLYSAHSA